MNNKTDKSKYFFFYENYADVIDNLTNEKAGRFIKTMCTLAFNEGLTGDELLEDTQILTMDTIRLNWEALFNDPHIKWGGDF